jgi:type IV fimbrial biogenesis protein FimT
MPAMRSPSIKSRSGFRGVTLIELCFSLAIAAVIVGMAAPGFQSTLRVAAVRSATFELLAGLQQTRGNAIVESRALSMCPSDASGKCVAAGVSTAYWHMALPEADRAAGVGRVLPTGVVVRSTRSPLWFSPDALGASNGTLTICDQRRIAPPRAIVLSVSGRARLEAAPAGACG